jgi:carbohydrate binding protein with CBM4/9 domain
MGRSRLLGSALAGGLVAGVLVSPAGLSVRPLADWTGARLVANAGFEASASAVSQWDVTGSGGTATVTAGPVHGGSVALKVTDTSAGTGGSVSVRSRPVAVVPGETLTAHAFAQRVDQTAGSLYLEYWRPDGTRIDGAVVATDVTGATGWQALTVGAVAPDDATTATVLVYSKESALGTTVWDDVTLDSAPPPARKVPNSSFEDLHDSPLPSPWSVTGSAQLVTSPVHTGDRALRMVDGSGTTGVTALSKAIPVTGGETLTATAWYQLTSGLTGSLYLEYRKADGSSSDPYKAHVDVTAGSGWRRLTVSKTAPSDATSVTLRLYSENADTGTTVWDDVTLRSSVDSRYAEAVGTGSVLFIGDQRVESYTGMTRVVVRGTPRGDTSLTDGATGVVLGGGTWDANPRFGGAVLRDTDGTYRMWYNSAAGTGLATSADGVHWTRYGTGPVSAHGPGGIAENPRYDPGNASSMRYYTLYPKNGLYSAMASRDGITWTDLNGGNTVLPGFDVVNVGWDPTNGGRFVALSKQYPTGSPYGARTVYTSFSTDFVHWTAPRFALASDALDHEKVAARYPSRAGASSEIYGMAGMRYGEQFIGVPWMFDVHERPNALGNPGDDIGRAHLELAASTDLLNWSRPARDAIVTEPAQSAWNWGFQVGGGSLLTVGDEARYYYGSFAGEHSCGSEDVPGLCAKATGNSKIALLTWKRDRFEAFHAASGGGGVTTRTLAPTGTTVTVNANLGTAGQLHVALLDAAGTPVPGYETSNPITGDTLGTAVAWGTRTTIPATGGPFRLRFELTEGDLYSYSIS